MSRWIVGEWVAVARRGVRVRVGQVERVTPSGQAVALEQSWMPSGRRIGGASWDCEVLERISQSQAVGWTRKSALVRRWARVGALFPSWTQQADADTTRAAVARMRAYAAEVLALATATEAWLDDGGDVPHE